jgi:hypothetical protein
VNKKWSDPDDPSNIVTAYCKV